MKVISAAYTWVLVALLALPVAADRCIGPKDNTVGHQYGVDLIDPAEITWCDDFDSYCDANCGDCATGEPTSTWPGYPSAPDNLCSDPLDVSQTLFLKPYEWPNTTVSHPDGLSNAEPVNGPWFWEGWDGSGGWATEPYTLQYRGGVHTNQYHTFDLEPAIVHRFPNCNLLNGTDANPLTLRFWMTPAEIPNPETGKLLEVPANLAMYVELRRDDDHAPTDYVLRDCSPEGQGPYPMVCQQRHIPAGCPATLSPTIHQSLAFGWLSTLDTNPCDVENGRKPTNYHAAAFDGNRWTQIFFGALRPQVGEFNWDKGQAYFEMKITTDYAYLKHIAYKDLGNQETWELRTSTATMPRVYKGAFNRVSIGVAPGCRLDANGQCMGEPDVWRYMVGHESWGWSDNYVDRVALLGGVAEIAKGACCLADNSCTFVTPQECQAAGGLWTKPNQQCENTSCCPVLFGDHDRNSMVDMADFAALQRCTTTGGGAAAPGCACFDFDGNDVVGNTDDVEHFIECARGPGVPGDSSAACQGVVLP
jgi:hypothetical protein